MIISFPVLDFCDSFDTLLFFELGLDVKNICNELCVLYMRQSSGGRLGSGVTSNRSVGSRYCQLHEKLAESVSRSGSPPLACSERLSDSEGDACSLSFEDGLQSQVLE